MSTPTSSYKGRVSFLRHSGWVGPEDFVDPLHIVGCGAVGSHIALLAAKMGFSRFHLWDADKVEPHNLANQAYDVEHVGLLKTEALSHVLKRFNPIIKTTEHPMFFESKEHTSTLLGPLVIATDSMSSRMDIAKAFTLNPLVRGVHEVRLAFDYGECHTIDNMNLDECNSWTKTLRPDDEIPEGPCNLRICTTLVQLVSSLTVQNICSYYAAERQHVPWVYQKKARLSLTNQLRLIYPK